LQLFGEAKFRICGAQPRWDARRDRERILKTAKAAFTRQGANASLDEIV